MHVHTAYSEDFTLTLEDAVERCRLNGIDGILLAECDVIPNLEEVAAVAESTGFPIFVGVDIDADDGRVIAVPSDPTDERFANQTWCGDDDRPTVSRVIDVMSSLDGVVLAAHPYLDDGGPFLGDRLYKVEGLAGVEVACGVKRRLSNDLALEAAVGLGLPTVGGSDTGPEGQRLGHYATLFADQITSQEELVEALQGGTFWAVEIRKSRSDRSRRDGRSRERGGRDR